MNGRQQSWLARQRYAAWAARAFWLACLLLSLYVFIISNPSRYRQIQDAFTLNGSALEQLGFTRQSLPSYMILLDTLTFSVYALVGALIFARKSADGVALFGSLALVTAGFTIARPADALFFVPLHMRLPILLLFMLGTWSLLVFLYVFPDGHFSPHWMRWVALLTAGLPVGVYLSQILSLRPQSWPPPGIAIATLPAIALSVLAQVYRYRHVANRSQKQQTKWVVYGLGVGASAMVGFQLLVPVLIPAVHVPGPERAAYIVLGVPLFYAGLLALPVTIAMSVLRYRLWEIDLIIRRTLIYGATTAALAGLFAATITLSQKLLLFLTGQQSDLAAVIATLLVVAVFTPIKDALQRWIDRRLESGAVPAARLHALMEHLHARVSPVDPYQISHRLVDEAVAAFGAAGGSVYWEVNGTPRRIYYTGDGDGDAAVSVKLQGGPQNPPIGYMNLTVRRNGADYTEKDREVLQQAASAIALAIEQDGTHA
jgi:hypothetical protein